MNKLFLRFSALMIQVLTMLMIRYLHRSPYHCSTTWYGRFEMARENIRYPESIGRDSSKAMGRDLTTRETEFNAVEIKLACLVPNTSTPVHSAAQSMLTAVNLLAHYIVDVTTSKDSWIAYPVSLWDSNQRSSTSSIRPIAGQYSAR